MATVNLAWTLPTNLTDVVSLDVFRWDNNTLNQSEVQSSLTSYYSSGSSANRLKQLGVDAGTSLSDVAYSDTTAPVTNLTYAVVSRNAEGFKLESNGFKTITTT